MQTQEIKIGTFITTIFGKYKVVEINKNPDYKPLICERVGCGKRAYFHYRAVKSYFNETI